MQQYSLFGINVLPQLISQRSPEANLEADRKQKCNKDASDMYVAFCFLTCCVLLILGSILLWPWWEVPYLSPFCWESSSWVILRYTKDWEGKDWAALTLSVPCSFLRSFLCRNSWTEVSKWFPHKWSCFPCFFDTLDKTGNVDDSGSSHHAPVSVLFKGTTRQKQASSFFPRPSPVQPLSLMEPCEERTRWGGYWSWLPLSCWKKAGNALYR